MKVLITGANGFMGKNLQLHLAERKDVEVVCFTRDDDVASCQRLAAGGGLCVSLGRHQPPARSARVCHRQCGFDAVVVPGRWRGGSGDRQADPVVYTSSTQAGRDNPYGQSKRGAEEALLALAAATRCRCICSGCPMCLESGASPTTTRRWPRFATTLPAGCPFRSMTRLRRSRWCMWTM